MVPEPLRTGAVHLYQIDEPAGSSDTAGSEAGVTVSAPVLLPPDGRVHLYQTEEPPSATGELGTVTVTGTAEVYPSGLEATGAIGQVTFALSIVVNVTGVSGTMELGTVVASGGATATPTGVYATGEIGQVNVWGQIDDGQVANWQNINDAQTPTWVAVSDTQTAGWQQVVT